MKYAVECEVIDKARRIGMFKVERSEVVAWDFEQYARLLAAAKVEGEEWYAAICLAGEAGLRVGEVNALRWREDVDMIAWTITVNQQMRNKQTTTPKGRTPRTIPMTSRLHNTLKRMSVIREGFVVRNLDGSAKTDDQADKAIQRICRRAGLPARLFHTLRHTFGGRFVANSMRFNLELASMDHGIAMLDCAVARSAEEAASVVRVLSDWCPAPAAVHALTPSKLLLPRTRLFLDALGEHLRTVDHRSARAVAKR